MKAKAIRMKPAIPSEMRTPSMRRSPAMLRATEAPRKAAPRGFIDINEVLNDRGQASSFSECKAEGWSG